MCIDDGCKRVLTHRFNDYIVQLYNFRHNLLYKNNVDAQLLYIYKI